MYVEKSNEVSLRYLIIIDLTPKLNFMEVKGNFDVASKDCRFYICLYKVVLGLT